MGGCPNRHRLNFIDGFIHQMLRRAHAEYESEETTGAKHIRDAAATGYVVEKSGEWIGFCH